MNDGAVGPPLLCGKDDFEEWDNDGGGGWLWPRCVGQMPERNRNIVIRGFRPLWLEINLGLFSQVASSRNFMMLLMYCTTMIFPPIKKECREPTAFLLYLNTFLTFVRFVP